MMNLFKQNKQQIYSDAKKEAEEVFNVVQRNNQFVIIYGYNKVVVSTPEDGQDLSSLVKRLAQLRDTYIENYLQAKLKYESND